MNKKTIQSACLSIGIGLVFAILILELFTRVICYMGVRPGYTVHEYVKTYPEYVWSQFTSPTLARKEHLYDFGPYDVKINAHGYRGEMLPREKKAGYSRLIFLGGSHTFDILAPEGKDWPHLVGDQLRSQGKQVEIMNAGVPGHRSWASLGKTYSELWAWKPDVLIVNGAWNDIKYFSEQSKKESLMAIHLHHKLPRNPNHPEQQLRLLDHIFSWSWAYAKIRVKYYRLLYKRDGRVKEILHDHFSEVGPEQYSINLELMYHLAKRLDARLVLVKQPRLVTGTNTDRERKMIAYQKAGLSHDAIVKAFEACDQVIDQLAKKYSDILVIDASKEISGKREYFEDHIHTTEEGSAVLASIVAKELLPAI